MSNVVKYLMEMKEPVFEPRGLVSHSSSSWFGLWCEPV